MAIRTEPAHSLSAYGWRKTAARPEVRAAALAPAAAHASMPAGLTWGAAAGALTVTVLLSVLQWAGYPHFVDTPYALLVPFVYWAVVVPVQILLGSVVGAVTGAACSAVGASRPCRAALLGSAGVAGLLWMWLFVQFI